MSSINISYIKELILVPVPAVKVFMPTADSTIIEVGAVKMNSDVVATRFIFEGQKASYSIQEAGDMQQISISFSIPRNTPERNAWLILHEQKEFYVFIKDRNNERVGIFSEDGGVAMSWQRVINERNTIEISLSAELVNCVYLLNDEPGAYLDGNDFGFDFNISYG